MDTTTAVAVLEKVETQEVTSQNASIATIVLGPDDDYCQTSSTAIIRLSQEELDLFTLVLVPAVNEYNATVTTDATVTLRVAGGWVRDKLRNGVTATNVDDVPDVDIAVQGMSGIACAQLLQSYVLKRVGLPKVRSIGVIKANPDQSKHLETATLKIGNIDIDLCQLRGQEEYDNDNRSRIPIIRQVNATPFCDTERRDFTVNAMYYNIHTRCVEDWTHRGIEDLFVRKVLSTPISPHTTFYDDPLRVLRAVRFAVRCQLRLHDDVISASRSTAVQTSLLSRVSRERVGKELEGMLSGLDARPVVALHMLHDLHLLASCVLCLPTIGAHCTVIRGTWKDGEAYTHGSKVNSALHSDDDKIRDIGKEGIRHVDCIEAVATAIARETTIQQQSTTSTTTLLDTRLLTLSAVLLPVKDLIYTETRKTPTSTAIPKDDLSVAGFIIKESLKYKHTDASAVVCLHSAVNRFIQYTKAEQTDATTTTSRLELGLLVRELKGVWVTCLALATVSLIEEQQLNASSSVAMNTNDTTAAVAVDWIACMVRLYKRIVVFYTLDVHCWKQKPLLNGKSIMRVLKIKGGPSIKIYVDLQISFMLAHPNATVDDCSQYLVEQQQRIASSSTLEPPPNAKKNKMNL